MRLPLLVSLSLGALPALAGQTYTPCDETMSGQTVTLTGHDLTIEQIVDVARHGAVNLVEAGLWLDVRKTQDPQRTFGPAPKAVWKAFRKRLPLEDDTNPNRESKPMVAAEFLRANPPVGFFTGAPPPGISP